jgi:hypothetical protein
VHETAKCCNDVRYLHEGSDPRRSEEPMLPRRVLFARCMRKFAPTIAKPNNPIPMSLCHARIGCDVCMKQTVTRAQRGTSVPQGAVPEPPTSLWPQADSDLGSSGMRTASGMLTDCSIWLKLLARIRFPSNLSQLLCCESGES